MPFGVADELLICVDYLTVAQTFSLYTDLMAQSFGHKIRILKPIMKPISWVSHKITQKLEPAPEVKEIPKKNIRWFK
jgi:hypothetical protein